MMLSELKTGKSITVHFSYWIRFRRIFLGGASQSLELTGDSNLLLMDFVTKESVIFTSLGIKIGYILIEKNASFFINLNIFARIKKSAFKKSNV